MTHPQVEPRPRETIETVDETHVLCCEGPDDVALCGAPIVVLLPSSTPTTCVVCADLDLAEFCPQFGVCHG